MSKQPEDIVKEVIEDKSIEDEVKLSVLDKERKKVWDRLAELQKQDEEEEVKQIKVAVKTMAEILKDEDKPIEAYVKCLDAKILYKKFSVQDWLETQSLEHMQFVKEAVYRVWSKADSTVTREGIDSMPFETVQEIYSAIDSKTPFLSPKLLERQVLFVTLQYLESLILSLKITQASRKSSSQSTESSSFPGSSSISQTKNV